MRCCGETKKVKVEHMEEQPGHEEVMVMVEVQKGGGGVRGGGAWRSHSQLQAAANWGLAS